MSGNLAAEFKSYRARRASGPEAERREKSRRGRESFREYVNLINPDFFRPERTYQGVLAETMQQFYENKLISASTGDPCDILIVNMPPGFGKSYTASLFTTWIYGQNIRNQVMEISYNQTLSSQFSKTVRELINDEEIQGDNDYFTVRSFFPSVRIKFGDGAVDRWSLEGWYNSYLATSFDGSLTGMRGTIGIIDDPIKSAEEALNENIKAKHWHFYKNTFQSRMLDGGKQIIIQTRWATDDLAGMILKESPERCYELCMKALDHDGRSLCEDLYSTKDLLKKKSTIDEHIWLANFMQEPIDLTGALYGDFKTYDELNADTGARFAAYGDTADEGADFLCLVCGVIEGRYGYVTDVYYTDEPMEKTEPTAARVLAAADTRECLIESNNGGRGFARNISRELLALGAKKCGVTWFHQSKNKKTRILVNASNVMDQIYMPEGWKRRWPEFYAAIRGYQRKGRNAHDDAADALTGFVEMINGDVKGRRRAKTMSKSIFGGRL
jgi:predicted phage terminase large subunit-like protein